MRALVAAIALSAMVTGCGGDSGILLSVSADDTVTAEVSELRFFVGVVSTGANGETLLDESGPDIPADVSGRDLAGSPYKLLLHDGSTGDTPSTITVAVIGYAGDAEVAFAGMTPPQTFMPDSLIKRDMVLASGSNYWTTATGCVGWDNTTISVMNDRDCDGDPADTDCDDTDPTRSSLDGTCIVECETASECAPLHGDAPCGAWECNVGLCEVVCPDCTDGDSDGYGVGSGCAGPDCDDDDDTVGESTVASCYSGPGGTEDKGSCRVGASTCTAGVWGPCVGEVVPAGEACNTEDDDCDDQVDEDLGQVTCGLGECQRFADACGAGGVLGVCVPGSPVGEICGDNLDNNCNGLIDENCPTCLRVVPVGGNDTVAAGDVTFNAPFATIQAAINFAAANASAPQRVCVAADALCGRTAGYSEAVVMAAGVHVYGGYESTGWTRCNQTSINNTSPQGVYFPSSITETTILDGMRINRFASASTTGVTIDGASRVQLSNIQIENMVTSMSSYGVALVNGAEATIRNSSIYGGNGSVETIGVVSKGSQVALRQNCSDYDAAGRCDNWCQTGSQPAIRGRFVDNTGVVFAVSLEDSPNSVIEESSICANRGDSGGAIRIKGEADNVVIRKNHIGAFGGFNSSYGILMESCNGAAPWIVDNYQMSAEGPDVNSVVNVIRAVGDCHPTIDNNGEIFGGNEGQTVGTVGIYCGADTVSGVTSLCSILGNQHIRGSNFGFPPFAAGVQCANAGCNRIANNVINGNSADRVYGIWLDEAGPFIDRNTIIGGCGTTVAMGVRSQFSYARLQNNFINAGFCEDNATNGTFVGVHNQFEPGGYELELHSNTIFGGGDTTQPCMSMAVRNESLNTGAANSGSGVFRNNIFAPGHCSTLYNFVEADASADPRILENNNFDVHKVPTALYRDEGTTNVSSVATINAMSGSTSSSNISVDSLFVSYPGNLHITGSSLCVAAGTSTGAPLVDFDGDTRDSSAPDIGADEL